MLTACYPRPASALEVRVDCSRRLPEIRPLHGVNNGPLNYGETIDLSDYFRELAIPSARLHDCEWPNPDVVDIHAVFPDMTADPALPESYTFSRTDDYVKAIIETGTAIVYRLGESIEHSKKKYNVNPPEDPRKWAQICLGIIRHYNRAWADGFRYNIKYWEIWNEPENRPTMWTGTDEQFDTLYTTAAKAIKAEFPHLMVGGPSAGAQGKLVAGKMEPWPFLKKFFEACKAQNAPLDFFSWHTYTNDPYLYVTKARAIRKMLDEFGFEKTEIHLNEWNYLPDDDWTPLGLRKEGIVKKQWFDRIAGPEGAAFLACVLIYLQDAPVDVANYYAGDTNWFGLFGRYGQPRKNFYAAKAFKMLLDTPLRVKAFGAEPGKSAICAGLSQDQTELTILISNLRSSDKQFRLTVENFAEKEKVNWSLCRVDVQNDLNQIRTGVLDPPTIELNEVVEAPSVVLLRMKKARIE